MLLPKRAMTALLIVVGVVLVALMLGAIAAVGMHDDDERSTA
jgi:hypothetical protein